MPPVPSLFRRAVNPLALLRRSAEDPLTAPISAFESETQAVIVRTSPYSEHAILHVLSGIVVTTLILMAVVKLDIVVTGTGVINPAAGNLYVQPLDKAIIKSIRVKKGDFVTKGQVIADLDPTFAQADVAQYREHLEYDKALIARLEAEQADKPYVGGTSKSELQQYAVWTARQQEFKRQVQNYDEQIKANDALIAKAEKDISGYTLHISNTTGIASMEEELETKGYGSKLKKLTAEDARDENTRLLNESRNERDNAVHTSESLKAQRASYIGQWLDQLGTLLASTKDDLNQTESALAKAEKTAELISLVAPDDAVVLTIAQASAGMVYDPAPAMGGTTPPLFTLAPISGPLEAEVDIPSTSDGFPKVGDPVVMKLDTFPFMRYGTVSGTVRALSDGSFTLDQNNQPTPAYFKAFVTLGASHMHDVPRHFRMNPGITLTGDIMLGKRTILSYLVEGGLRRATEALREP